MDDTQETISLVPKLAFSLIISSQKVIQYALQRFSRKAVGNLERSKLSGITDDCLFILLFLNAV